MTFQEEWLPWNNAGLVLTAAHGTVTRTKDTSQYHHFTAIIQDNHFTAIIQDNHFTAIIQDNLR